MSNATAAPRTHLTKSWTTNDTNLKCKKERATVGSNITAYLAGNKKALNVYDIINT